jgi:hypothetical protein
MATSPAGFRLPARDHRINDGTDATPVRPKLRLGATCPPSGRQRTGLSRALIYSRSLRHPPWELATVARGEHLAAEADGGTSGERGLFGYMTWVWPV